MDYTSIPRSLFYKEKTDLSIFTRNTSDDSLEYQYFKRLKRCPPIKSSIYAQDYVQIILNNACYISTLIYYETQPSLYFAKYLKIARENCKEYVRKSLVSCIMALVYNWINSKRFIELKQQQGGDLEDLREITEGFFECYTGETNIFRFEELEKKNFLSLVLEMDKYISSITVDDLLCRPIKEALEDRSVSVEELVVGIDYICNSVRILENESMDCKYYLLSSVMDRIKEEAGNNGNLSALQISHAFSALDMCLDSMAIQLKEEHDDTIDSITAESVIGDLQKRDQEIDQLRKERDEWKQKYENELKQEPEKAFNGSGNPCFTSRQMGIFLHVVALQTEGDSYSGKSSIGEIVEKISGYKATTASQNMKGNLPERDKEIVAEAIKSVLPKLAEKVRKC